MSIYVASGALDLTFALRNFGEKGANVKSTSLGQRTQHAARGLVDLLDIATPGE
jgi:hypothetical protein